MEAAVDAAGALGCQRHLFDADDDLSYFDCAAISPLLRASVAAAESAIDLRAKPWLLSKASWFESADERRSLVGRLLGCSPGDVALVPSTSYAAALCVRACALTAKLSILALPDEFPSTFQTWQSVARSTGARIIIVEPDAGEGWTEAVLRALTPGVGLVSVPTVRWTDGARLDVARIARAARDCGALMFVDATQSLGAMPLDVRSVPAHFIAASGYKWLLGPYGHSYLYVAPECQEKAPLEENWIAREGADDFARLTRPRPRYRSGARRFDAGQQAGFELGAMACAALRQIDSWGVERISTALGRITDRIERSARSAGLAIAAEGRRAPHIVSVAVGHVCDVQEQLVRSKVRASLRAGLLRLSPHLFIDEHDIRRLEHLFRSIASGAS